jgi:hypothetical protein
LTLQALSAAGSGVGLAAVFSSNSRRLRLIIGWLLDRVFAAHLPVTGRQKGQHFYGRSPS